MMRHAKQIMARFLAVVMILSLLPFDMLGTANVVMAEELEGSADAGYTLEDAYAGNNDANIINPESIGGIPEDDGNIFAPKSEDGTTGNNVDGEPKAAEDDADTPPDDDVPADTESGASDGAGPVDADTPADADGAAGTGASDGDGSADADTPIEAEEPSNAENSTDSVTHILRPGALDSDFFTLTSGASYEAEAGGTKYIDLNGTATVASLASDKLGRIKLGGKGGSATAKSIKFTVGTGYTANVKAYLISSRTSTDSSGNPPADATVGLYKDGTSMVATGTALCDTTYGTESKPIPATISKNNLESGTYYLYAPSSSEVGANLYYMEVALSQGTGNTDPAPTDIPVTLPDSGIITSAVVGAGASFVNKETQADVTPTAITLNAEAKTAETVDNAAAIKTAVDNLNKDLAADAKADVKILYYDLTIADQNGTAIDLKQGTGVITIKMPYSISSGAGNKNKIIVLHDTETLKVKKDAEGFSFDADGFSPYTVIIQPPSDAAIEITESEGYEEGAYAEWEPVDGADGYVAYVSANKDSFTESNRIDNELIREYEDHWRVDTVGLKAGTYYIKVAAVTVDGTDANGRKELTEIAQAATEALTVVNHDRSGFAFSPKSPNGGEASGAYKADGTLKAGAQVVYVTAANAKTCKATVGGQEVTGFQGILDAKQKKNTSNDIVDIRIIGCIKKSDLDHISSSAEGIQVKGNSGYTDMNITIEGIGEDATVWGFGFLLRNCSNVEFRNFGILNCMDDGVSIDTDNSNLWMHHLDIFYGKRGSGDKAKGDGALDIKLSQYCTVSYVHFWDTGKCCLIDASPETSGVADYLTYHHNWFDHSDSRHPRVRNGKNFHIYNNYYDGNAKYGVGATTGSSTFVEANYFRNCAHPMMIANQGTDAKGDGTFSGEPGGIIKAYNNYIVGATSYDPYSKNPAEFDAYDVANRNDTVPSSVKTKAGATYSNFDTDSSMYTYTPDTPEAAKANVMAHAGRLGRGDLQWTFGASEDTNYAIIEALASAVLGYTSTVKSIGGVDGVVGSGSSGGDNEDPGDPGSAYVHNFTTAGMNSDSFFTISGNEKSGATSRTYTDYQGQELTLSKAMKMESATSVTFVANGPGKLVLVHDSGFTGKTKVDGTKVAATGGVIELKLDEGNHTVEKADTANLYYIAFIPDGSDASSVSVPVCSMVSGDVPLGTTITISCSTDEAVIRYMMTTDGTEPAEPDGTSTRYSGGIPLGNTENAVIKIKAVAILGEDKSAVVSRTYTLIDPDAYVSEPEATPGEGSVAKGTTVVLESATSGAEVYYTISTNGAAPADPTASSTKYTAAIAINEGTIIKAIAIKGTHSSAISTFTYTISTSGQENTGDKTFEFNPQKENMAIGANNDDVIPANKTKYGTDEYFTIANGSGGKAIIKSTGTTGTAAPAGSKSSSGITTYDRRFQFGGAVSSKTGDGAIKFTTYGSAKVTVCAYLTGKDSNTGEYKARNVYLDTDANKWKPAGGTPEEHQFEAAAGEHGIYAKDGDLAILYVVVEDTNVPGAGRNPDPGSGDDDNKDDITITINLDGGTSSVTGPLTITKGTELTKTMLPDPAREGYEFTGWVDGSGNKVTIPFTPTANMTLKATWKQNGGGDGDTTASQISIVGLEESYEYTGAKIIPNIGVIDYDIGDGKLLAPGVDYTVKYTNNVKVSTSVTDLKKKPTVTVIGKGNYAGKDTSKTFIIKDAKDAADGVKLADLKGAKIKKIDPVTYDGKPKNPDIELTLKGKPTVKYVYNETSGFYEKEAANAETGTAAETEYIPAKVSVSNNLNKGTAAILLTGENGKNSKPTTVKATFKINAIDLSKAAASALDVKVDNAEYAAKGAKPEVTVTYKFEGDEEATKLRNGIDYTVKYSSNKNAGTDGKVVITGKGNYAKKYMGTNNTFKITALDMSGLEVKAVTAYTDLKAGKVKATVVDKNGDIINASQYTVEVYTDAACEKSQLVAQTEKLVKDADIYVKAVAKDAKTKNLSGETPAAKFKVGTNISKAKVKLKFKSKPYTGAAVELENKDLEVTIKEGKTPKTLTMQDDDTVDGYKIEYSGNINKGNAIAVIKGTGSYSGTKTVKFKIVGKTMEIKGENTAWDDVKDTLKNFVGDLFN